MSQSGSESPLLRAVIANIVTPAHTERDRCLAELADHAFDLADVQAGGDPNNVPSGIFIKRQARILYSVKSRGGLPLPIKVILYQDVPAGQIQRVVVNLQTEIVQCEGKPSLPIETSRIKLVQKVIKPYLRKTLKILQEIWGEISDSVRDSAWQDFSERLTLNDVSSAQSQVCAASSFFEKACLSCDVSTTLCTSCHAAICLSWDCPASGLVPFQSCSRHPYIATCLPCLQTAKTIPPLGQCPECNLWFCDYELAWCLGRPKETPNQTPSNTVSISVREHPAKPIACNYCNRDQEIQDVSECSNKNCWSREGNFKNSRICQSCSPAGGISCACEDDWICDNCKEPPMALLKQCPRCKRAYCVSECEYIQFCAECGRTTLCDDCAEEDQSSFAGQDGPEVQEVKFVGVCQTDSCSKKFCEECLEERKCAGCNETYCSPCLPPDQCNSCHLWSNVCEKCLNQRECSGCYNRYCSSCKPSEQCTSCPGRDSYRGGMRWRVPVIPGQGLHQMWMYL